MGNEALSLAREEQAMLPRRRSRLALEALEDRQVLSALVSLPSLPALPAVPALAPASVGSLLPTTNLGAPTPLNASPGVGSLFGLTPSLLGGLPTLPSTGGIVPPAPALPGVPSLPQLPGLPGPLPGSAPTSATPSTAPPAGAPAPTSPLVTGPVQAVSAPGGTVEAPVSGPQLVAGSAATGYNPSAQPQPLTPGGNEEELALAENGPDQVWQLLEPAPAAPAAPLAPEGAGLVPGEQPAGAPANQVDEASALPGELTEAVDVGAVARRLAPWALLALVAAGGLLVWRRRRAAGQEGDPALPA
jgi:hypothetical protein